MRLLLDTHILIWALRTPDRLDGDTREQLSDPANEVLFSSASIWEIAIKAGLGRPDFTLSPDAVAIAAHDTGFTELPVRAGAAARISTLPPIHRDPFDRLLIAQALTEPAILLTVDHQLAAYSELVRLVGPSSP